MKGNKKVTMDSLLGIPSKDEEWFITHGFARDDISGVWTLTKRPDCLDFLLDDWDIKVAPTMKGEWEARVWYVLGDGDDAPKCITAPYPTPEEAMRALAQYLENLRMASWTKDRLRKLLERYFPAPEDGKDPGLWWLSERGFTPALLDNDWEKTIGESLVRVSRYPDKRWWARCIGKSGTVHGSPAAYPKEALMDLLAVMASNGDSPFTEDDE